MAVRRLGTRRRCHGALLSLAVAACCGLALRVAFVPLGGSAAAPPSRRAAIFGASVAATTAGTIGTGVPAASAAGAPKAVDVSGLAGKRADLNGRWSQVAGQDVNSRAAYKKDGQTSYLVFNDCGSFQLSPKASGKCDGFASEVKGKWTVDGAASSMKISPVKDTPDEAVTTKAVAAERPAFNPPPLPSFLGGPKEPEKVLTQEEESEAAVGKAINAEVESTLQEVLQGYMTLGKAEEDISDRLASKLGSRLGAR